MAQICDETPDLTRVSHHRVAVVERSSIRHRTSVIIDNPHAIEDLIWPGTWRIRHVQFGCQLWNPAVVPADEDTLTREFRMVQDVPGDFFIIVIRIIGVDLKI